MNRRTGQIALGILWLSDGILKMLPGTANSFLQVIQEQADDQPSWLHSAIVWGSTILQPHPTVWAYGLGAVEIVLGLAIVFSHGERLKLALLATMLLAAPIWV